MMGPVHNVLRCYLRYFGFWSRASRREFNWFMLFIVIVIGTGFVYLDIADAQSIEAWDRYSHLTQEEQIAFIAHQAETNWPRPGATLTMLALTVIPGFAVAVRRGHDIGIDGATAAVSFATPLGIIGLMREPGMDYENEYGPVPP